MPQSTPPPSRRADNTGDIPRAFRHLGVIVSVAEVILGSVAVLLTLRYGGRRSVAVLIAMAALLLAYIALRYWRRYEEHPDRGRSIRGQQPPRSES